jgi:membrane-associated phospholipid phosphatase
MWMDPRIARPLFMAAAAAAALLCLLIGAYYVGPVSSADAIALHGLGSLTDHPLLRHASDLFAHSADPLPIVAGVAALCAIAVAQRRPMRALAAIALVGGAGVAALLFKTAAAHPRYHPVLGFHQLDATAFPSGHTTAAMSLALAGVMVAGRRWRTPAAIAAGVYVLGVAVSLIILRWHFPSDVLGGMLVATMVSLLVLAGLRLLERRPLDRAVAPRLSPRSVGIRTGEAMVGLLAAAAVGAVLIRPHEVAGFAAAHTSATLAVAAIAAVAVGLVSALAAELEAG